MFAFIFLLFYYYFTNIILYTVSCVGLGTVRTVPPLSPALSDVNSDASFVTMENSYKHTIQPKKKPTNSFLVRSALRPSQ